MDAPASTVVVAEAVELVGGPHRMAAGCVFTERHNRGAAVEGKRWSVWGISITCITKIVPRWVCVMSEEGPQRRLQKWFKGAWQRAFNSQGRSLNGVDVYTPLCELKKLGLQGCTKEPEASVNTQMGGMGEAGLEGGICVYIQLDSRCYTAETNTALGEKQLTSSF